MVETMELLQELQTIRPVEFFSTHPNPESRIAYIEERIERRYASLGTLKQGQAEYEEAVLSRLKDRRGSGVMSRSARAGE
jgi:predicted Zn-dependent protease